MTFKKAREDLAKAVVGPEGKPAVFLFICRASVSAEMRDQIRAEARKLGVTRCECLSGVEFEERLRRDAESLLLRFTKGVEFPDAPEDLAGFVGGIGPANDRETIRQMAWLFERPAFYTAMGEESCLPAFKQAITDTIQALNTGIWQTRDGQLIERIPPRHHLLDDQLRQRLTEVERGLARLRATYDELSRAGKLRPCGCERVDCPILFMDLDAVRELERVRDDSTSEFRAVCSELGVTLNLGWR